MKEYYFVVGKRGSGMYYAYKQYFYNLLIDGLDELTSYLDSGLNRYLLYDDVVKLITVSLVDADYKTLKEGK